MAQYNEESGNPDPWQHLTMKASKMRLPNRAVLTKEGPFGRHRPEPEVVEHMLDDLESRMRNYFLLYTRERDTRKQTEEQCYRLEQELVEERKNLAIAHAKIEQMDTKIKAIIGQPIKIKETIDKIEVLCNQLDTLVQAFVGIGSCATLQSQNRVAFLKLFLEYLYPCRDLDVRLNTLYTAIYSSLSYSGSVIPPNEILAPMESIRSQPTPTVKTLSGLYIMVHQLMLKKSSNGNNTEPGSYSCRFRYDHEPANIAESNPNRVLTVSAKPLDVASGIIEFNGCIQVDQLPPRIPNVIPKLILEIRTDSDIIGSANMSIVDERTLKAREPWAVSDAKGNQCGDVIVTIRPNPGSAKLPAVGFAKRHDEVLLSTSKPAGAEQPSQFIETVPDKPIQQKETKPFTPTVNKPQSFSKPATGPAAETPKTEQQAKPFQPMQKTTIRKPLFLKGKTAAKPTPLGGETKPAEEPKTRAPVAEKTKESVVEAASPPVAPQVVKKPPPAEQPKPAVPESKAKTVPSVPKAIPKTQVEAAPAEAPVAKTATKAPIPAKSAPPPVTPKSVVKPETAPAQEPVVPKVTPKVVPPAEVKAPVVAPKVVPKAPKTVIAAKAPLPEVAPAPTEAPKAATAASPLVPIVVKPKLLLKKPLMPKKA